MRITILSTSDTHGFVTPTDFKQRDDMHQPFGFSRAAQVVSNARLQEADDEIVIAIENGDFIQGSPLTNFIAQKAQQFIPVYQEIYDSVGFDARVLGNHEFNFGVDYLKATESDKDVINANLLKANGVPFMGKPYKIVHRKGVKIAILGLTTSYIPHWEQQSNITGILFNDPVAVAKKWVPKLRELADVVIVSYHGGLERDPLSGELTETDRGENQGYALMRDVPGIDALITGHQHRRLSGKVNGVPFTQPGYRGSDVGCIHLDLQNQISDASLIQTATSVPQQEVMSAVDTAQQATEQYLDKPLGHLTQSAKFADPFAARRDNHPYIQLINRIASERLGVDIVANAIFNDAIHGFDTQVTRREVAINYPYAETLAILKITGSDFKLALEKYASYFSVLNDKIIISPNYQYPKPQHYNYDIWYGIVYAFDISQPIGSRLVDLQYHGHRVADEDELKVGMTTYRAIGGGDFSMFSPDKIIFEDTEEVADVIADYFMQHGTVTLTDAHNFKLFKS